jgi:hypothetical protein
MSSWSDNREKSSPIISLDQIMQRIKQVDSVLLKLSNDDDLHDDLKNPNVKIALNHWTGVSRLPPEEAELLQDNRRAVYVLKHLQILQSVCKEACIPVPLDHFLERKPKLSTNIVDKLLGNTGKTQLRDKEINKNELKVTSTAAIESNPIPTDSPEERKTEDKPNANNENENKSIVRAVIESLAILLLSLAVAIYLDLIDFPFKSAFTK